MEDAFSRLRQFGAIGEIRSPVRNAFRISAATFNATSHKYKSGLKGLARWPSVQLFIAQSLDWFYAGSAIGRD